MNLFTYGTLMDPRRFAQVSGRLNPSLPARVAGYRAEPLAGTPYLAAVADPDAELKGVIYLQVTFTQLRRLDVYEGAAYQRAPIVAHVGRRHLPAELYRRRDYT